MDLSSLKTLSPRVLRLALIAAVTTLAIGLGFRSWRPEAALQTSEYVLVFLICYALTYAASRILPHGKQSEADGKAPPAAEK